MPVSTTERHSDAFAAFWGRFDEAVLDSGLTRPEDISAALQRKSNYSLSTSTIRGWIQHKRLPRKDEDFAELCTLLVGESRVEELTALLRAARLGRDQPAPQPPNSPELAEHPPVADRTRRGPYRSPKLWGAVAAIVAGGAITGAALLNQAPRTNAESPPLGGTAPSSQSAAEASATGVPANTPCPSPTIRAESAKSRASATYCADQRQFLLFDDRADNKSAVLVVRVDGTKWPEFYNAEGYATRSPDGSTVSRKPPKPIVVSFDATATVDFQVCIGDTLPERSFVEDSCGAWASIQP